MASIEKRGPRKWQARIRMSGHNLTKTFDSRADAQAWIGETETQIRTGKYRAATAAERMKFSEVLKGYRDRRPRPKGAKTEGYRIDAMLRHPLAKRTPASLKTPDFTRYVNGRLEEGVTRDTVRRELGILRASLRWAKRNYDDFNIAEDPFENLEWPKPGKGRDRRLSADEMRRLGDALAVRDAKEIGKVIKNPGVGRGRGKQSARSPWLMPLVALAMETTMRRGEMLALRWDDIDFQHATARVGDSKNDDARLVPLSPYAITALRELEKQREGDDPRVIPATANAVSLAWRRAKKRAGIENFRFHDLRHEGTSKLFEQGFGVMEVAQFTGHRDLRMLKRYTHMEARRLAEKLRKVHDESSQTGT